HKALPMGLSRVWLCEMTKILSGPGESAKSAVATAKLASFDTSTSAATIKMLSMLGNHSRLFL
ncbi:MAG: hypothetical protein AAGL29_16365, partial [Bacteroidota bacterium]